MADEHDGFDTGSKDRATVALVAAEVREVKAIIAGHAELTAERLAAIRTTMAPLANIPERVKGLESQASDIERRVASIEKESKSNREWRRVSLPTLILTGGILIVALLAILLHG